MRIDRARCLSVLMALTLGACGGQQEDEPAAGATDESSTTPRECTLVVGWDPWEPYQYEDLGGELRGLDVEFVREVTAEIGCNARFLANDWASLLVMLRDGEIDMLAGATKTADREKFASFSEPYRDESFVLFVRTGEKPGGSDPTLQNLLDDGFRVGVVSQYVYGPEISGLQDDPGYADQFRSVPIAELNISNLINFEIDGFLEDPFVAAAVMRKKGLVDDIEALPLEIKTGDVRLMFSNASISPDVVAAIDQALATLQDDGRYTRLMSKYGK